MVDQFERNSSGPAEITSRSSGVRWRFNTFIYRSIVLGEYVGREAAHQDFKRCDKGDGRIPKSRLEVFPSY
jgi:hypothetical protein